MVQRFDQETTPQKFKQLKLQTQDPMVSLNKVLVKGVGARHFVIGFSR